MIIHSLYFQLCHQNSILADTIAHVRNRRKENIYEIPAGGINRSVKLFLLPIKLDQISIMMGSWNYKMFKSRVNFNTRLKWSGTK